MNEIKLLPAESMALSVGLSQVLRGEAPTTNVASVCILALARVTERHDWTACPQDEQSTTAKTSNQNER